ncbi:uncharacterized protein NEMAJ01_1744 [Nematocida major]|uniref:uncharacterized protein n=1 Tax=Nematocida major TaxID=1912982 RepID=UPI002007B635|nr:uncharacterized protein NEMAJ01_1744 [Nematocida major]KAH9386848.1 hypothetical protein NEMAJ01_1744 [Nematocida major]
MQTSDSKIVEVLINNLQLTADLSTHTVPISCIFSCQELVIFLESYFWKSIEITIRKDLTPSAQSGIHAIVRCSIYENLRGDCSSFVRNLWSIFRTKMDEKKKDFSAHTEKLTKCKDKFFSEFDHMKDLIFNPSTSLSELQSMQLRMQKYAEECCLRTKESVWPCIRDLYMLKEGKIKLTDLVEYTEASPHSSQIQSMASKMVIAKESLFFYTEPLAMEMYHRLNDTSEELSPSKLYELSCEADLQRYSVILNFMETTREESFISDWRLYLMHFISSRLPKYSLRELMQPVSKDNCVKTRAEHIADKFCELLPSFLDEINTAIDRELAGGGAWLAEADRILTTSGIDVAMAHSMLFYGKELSEGDLHTLRDIPVYKPIPREIVDMEEREQAVDTVPNEKHVFWTTKTVSCALTACVLSVVGLVLTRRIYS